MAGLFQMGQKIEVIVRKDDYGAATAGANEEKPETAGTNAPDQNGSGTANRSERESSIARRITITKIAATSIAVTRLGLNYYVGGVGYRNGDAAMQEAVQRNVEVAEEAGGILASVGIGMTYGIRGGVGGMALGGALALLTTATSLGFKYAGRYRDYNMRVFKEENAIEYRRARANLSLTTGRLR